MRFLGMSESERNALVARTLNPTLSKTRKRRAQIADYLACLEEEPEVLVERRLRATFVDEEVAEQVVKYASSVWNPYLNVCSRIAQGYAHPPIRTLEDDAAEQELLDFLGGPTRFNGRCKTWNLKAIALRTIVILVMPRRSRGRPCFDFRVVHGACAEVVQEPDAPFGDNPGILAYCLRRPEEQHEYYGARSREWVCVVDEEAYHYCDQGGVILRSEPHRCGRFPGATLRLTDPDGHDDDDWWAWRGGRSLAEATAVYGSIGAICEWARHTQFGKLITVTREDDTEQVEPVEEEGQLVGPPEAVFEAVGAKDVKVEEFDAPIDGFLKHQAAVLGEAARRATGSTRILDDQLLSDGELAQRHAVLLGLQRDQHGFLGPFERDLLEVMAAIGEAYGVEGMPTPAQLAGYDVTFIPLTFVSTPEARLRYFVDATKFGVADQVAFLQEQGWSEEEAIGVLEAIAKRRAKLHRIQATHNQPADPTEGAPEGAPLEELPGERPEAATGRAGGFRSGATRRAAAA